MGLFDKLFGPPSRGVFARELMTALRRAGDREDIVYEREQFRLVRPKSNDVTNLGSIYAEHCSLPRGQRKAQLNRLAEAFVTARNELPDGFDAARSNLRPKVWTRAQFANMELQQRLDSGKELDLPLYPLGEHLLTTVVYDQPASMRTLSEDDFEKWNTSYYEAMEAARANLDESTIAWAKIGDRFHSAMSGDNYDSSRVLLVDRIVDFDLLGDAVAMIPTRDSLHITGSDDVDGLKMMLDLTEKSLAEDPRPLSGVPLRLIEGEWDDWQPPADHPLAARFDWLRQRFLGGLYTDQQELLNAVHEKEGLDVFVASCSAVENPQTKQPRTYCVWSEGADSMLPETQLIMLLTEAALHGGEGQHVGGTWSHVRDVVGDLMQPVAGLYPPRWRIREFPSQQQLESIGKLDL